MIRVVHTQIGGDRDQQWFGEPTASSSAVNHATAGEGVKGQQAVADPSGYFGPDVAQVSPGRDAVHGLPGVVAVVIHIVATIAEAPAGAGGFWARTNVDSVPVEKLAVRSGVLIVRACAAHDGGNGGCLAFALTFTDGVVGVDLWGGAKSE